MAGSWKLSQIDMAQLQPHVCGCGSNPHPVYVAYIDLQKLFSVSECQQLSTLCGCQMVSECREQQSQGGASFSMDHGIMTFPPVALVKTSPRTIAPWPACCSHMEECGVAGVNCSNRRAPSHDRLVLMLLFQVPCTNLSIDIVQSTK